MYVKKNKNFQQSDGRSNVHLYIHRAFWTTLCIFPSFDGEDYFMIITVSVVDAFVIRALESQMRAKDEHTSSLRNSIQEFVQSPFSVVDNWLSSESRKDERSSICCNVWYQKKKIKLKSLTTQVDTLECNLISWPILENEKDYSTNYLSGILSCECVIVFTISHECHHVDSTDDSNVIFND